MVNEQTPPSSFQGRINPKQLFHDFREKKLLILFFFMISLIIGCVLVLNKKNSYEATAHIELPTETDVDIFNTERASQVWMKRGFFALLKPMQDLIFINRKILLSYSIKQNFFKNFYLPAYSPLTDNQTEIDKIYNKMNREVFIKDEIPGVPTYNYVLTVRSDDPNQAINLANNYILSAQKEIKHNIYESSQREIQALLENLTHQINSVKTLSKSERQDRIAQLTEALHLSQTIGKNGREDSPSHNSVALAAIAANKDNNLLFLRGSKVLQSEIDLLNKRMSDDAYGISGLRELEETYNFYKNLKVDPKSIPVIKLNGEILVKTISTNKAFILALFAIVGLMLGVFISLVGSIVKQLHQIK